MYFQVASKLAVISGTDSFSQAVNMTGGNAIFFDLTVFNNTGATLSAVAQQGNDLENWADVGGTITKSDAAVWAATLVQSIAAAYVRLRYSLNGTSKVAIVGAGINVANL